MKTLLFIVFLCVVLIGCAADQQGWKTAYENERQIRQTQDARIQALEQRQTQQPQPHQQRPPQRQRKTIEQVLADCKGVQNDRSTPVGCSTGTFKNDHGVDVYYLHIAFGNTEGNNKYTDLVMDKFGHDFCYITKQENVEGAIFFTIAEPTEKTYTRYCRTGENGEWKPSTFLKDKQQPNVRY